MKNNFLFGRFSGYNVKQIKRCVFVGEGAGKGIRTAKDLFIIKLKNFEEAGTQMSRIESYFLRKVFKRIASGLKAEHKEKPITGGCNAS